MNPVPAAAERSTRSATGSSDTMNLKDTYNKIAEDWHQNHAEDDWWKEGVDYFISQLPRGGSVLDAGCGSGIKSRYLISKGLRVTGIDFSEKLIEIAEREVPEATFSVGDLRNMDDSPEFFEGIFLQAVLLHFPHQEAGHILQNLVNKMKPGGMLYVAVKERRAGQDEGEIKEENDYGYSYKRFFSYYSQEEIEDYLKALDLEILFSKVSQIGETGWIQVIGRKKL